LVTSDGHFDTTKITKIAATGGGLKIQPKCLCGRARRKEEVKGKGRREERERGRVDWRSLIN